MMDDLAARVLAAIEAKEAKALAVPEDDREWYFNVACYAETVRSEGGSYVACGPWDGPITDHFGAHIADNDPVDVLRRCAKDREIVAEHSTPWTEASEGTVCEVCMFGWPCKTMRLLAEGYGIEVPHG